MEQKDRILLKTAAAMFVLLLFFFAQGAIVVITGIEGVPSAVIRGAVIWSLVAVTLAYYRIRYKGISKLGFHGMQNGAAIAVRDWTFNNTPFNMVYSYMKHTNEPSARTAMSYGGKQVYE